MTDGMIDLASALAELKGNAVGQFGKQAAMPLTDDPEAMAAAGLERLAAATETIDASGERRDDLDGRARRAGGGRRQGRWQVAVPCRRAGQGQLRGRRPRRDRPARRTGEGHPRAGRRSEAGQVQDGRRGAADAGAAGDAVRHQPTRPRPRRRRRAPRHCARGRGAPALPPAEDAAAVR